MRLASTSRKRCCCGRRAVAQYSMVNVVRLLASVGLEIGDVDSIDNFTILYRTTCIHVYTRFCTTILDRTIELECW